MTTTWEKEAEMQELTWPMVLLIDGILLVIGFVLVAPTGILARAINAVGSFIQRVIAWIAKLFS